MLSDSPFLEAAIKLAYTESHARLRSSNEPRYLPRDIVEVLANVNCSPTELDDLSRLTYPASLVQCLAPFSEVGLPSTAVEGPRVDELRQQYEAYLAKSSQLFLSTKARESEEGGDITHGDPSIETVTSSEVCLLAHQITSALERYLDQSLRTADQRLVDHLESVVKSKTDRKADNPADTSDDQNAVA